ncbi:DUF4247 domain-containing protein [Brevibacillus daliensis]|uniref:DUF4247 domain-containing protein n=1 Tax=Brevibacillus daliensis TaxID=2892995 RepID=UPI001E595126|nr:DUF4247 domain-containing protein [Brevibacillus daliensis]
MWNSLSKLIKTTLVLSLVVGLLTGCSDPSDSVSSSYPLEQITDNGRESSRIYRAENKTVPEVAKEIADERTPKEISKEDSEHMFLVYKDEWYHIQKDTDKPTDTLIEIDSQEFVQRNYSPSFLEMYFIANVLEDLIDAAKYKGNYRGYASRDVYQSGQKYHTPTVKEKKTYAPITTEKKGSILRRSSNADSKSTKSSDNGSLFKKPDAEPSGSTGKIIRDSDNKGSSIEGNSSSKKKKSSVLERPRTKSPPKVKKKMGSIKRRR